MIKRRHYTPEFKQQVVAESSRCGAAVAGVGLAHGINANQPHNWRRDLLRPQTPATRNALLKAYHAGQKIWQTRLAAGTPTRNTVATRVTTAEFSRQCRLQFTPRWPDEAAVFIFDRY